MQDGDKTMRSLLRWHAGIMVGAIAGGALLTYFYPTDWRIAGLAIASLLAACTLLISVSPRAFGYGILGTSVFTAAVAEFVANDSWPMKPEALSVMAATMGAGAIAYIFNNKRTGETDSTVQNIVGIAAVLGLLGVGTAVALLPVSIFASPLVIIVACESLAALADVAGERWRTYLAVAAIFPMGAMILKAAPPGDVANLYAAARTTAAFIYRHTGIDMFFAMAIGGLNAFLIVYQRTSNAGRATRGAILFAMLIGLLIFGVDIDFS